MDLFFVLSGYLITNQYLAKPSAGKPPEVWRFYARRLLRTLPNYYVILAICFLVGGTAAFPEGLWRYATFTQNFGVPATFSVSWSLCVEEQFYLVLPAAVAFLLGRRARVTTLAAVGLAFVGVAVRAGIWVHFRPDVAFARAPADGWALYLGKLYYPTYARLDGLLVGVLIATIRRFRPSMWAAMMTYGNALLSAGVVVLAIAYAVLVDQMGFVACVFGFPLLACGFGFVTAAALSPTSLLQRYRIPGIEALALLSYAMYLTHSEAIHVAGIIAERQGIAQTSGWFSVLTLTVIAAFAGGLYFTIEKPALWLRDQLFSSKSAEHLAADGTQSASS